MSNPENTRMGEIEFERLTRQEDYAQQLVAIQQKIRKVEDKLITELHDIHSQLQDIGRACAEAEKALDNIEPKPNRANSSFSRETGSASGAGSGSGFGDESAVGEGGVCFIVDDEVEYAKLVKQIVLEEMEDILKAEMQAAKAAKNGEGSSNEAK